MVTLERPEEGRLISTKLIDYTLSVYASADYLARNKPIREPADLADHLLITYIHDTLSIVARWITLRPSAN